MNILEFTRNFPTEKSCFDYLKLKREEQGITCKTCNDKKHYWFENQGLWKCAGCGSRTNLRSGTIMEKSKLPIMYWFVTIHLMTTVKKPFSALELQRQLGHKRYEPIWEMMHKVRMSMGKRDQNYKLEGEIEMDDAYFEAVDLGEKKSKEVKKRGRGSQKQAEVLVMVESRSNPSNTNKHRPSRTLGYIKMVTMDGITTNGINYEVSKAVKRASEVLTDGYPSYRQLDQVVKSHKWERTPAKEAHKKLPWVHTTISNAKRELLGVHHSIGKAYLQNYLNEFCYKLNRRFMRDNLFDRMISAGAETTWYN